MKLYVVNFILDGTSDINTIVFDNEKEAYEFYETFPKNYKAGTSITEINLEDYLEIVPEGE